MSNINLANIVLNEQSVSSLATHQEAVDYFANGGTIHNAAMQYANGADTFFHRGLIWVIQSGFNNLPANEKGKAPSIKQHMELVSLDSKNAARAMLQEIFSLAWQASQKGLDALAFASLRAMRDGIRAKDKTVDNNSAVEGLTADADADADANAVVKLEVSADDVKSYLAQAEVLEMLKAELSKAKPSIKAMREMIAA